MISRELALHGAKKDREQVCKVTVFPSLGCSGGEMGQVSGETAEGQGRALFTDAVGLGK